MFYGAAEFSRDTDLAILASPENLSRLSEALKELPKRGLIRKRSPMRQVALATVKDDLSKYLRLAADQEVIITRLATVCSCGLAAAT